MADDIRWLVARKAVRANRRLVLRAIKAKWRKRLAEVGISKESTWRRGRSGRTGEDMGDLVVGIRASHPAHPCGLCSTRPPQRWQPDWRRDAELELVEETGGRVMPDLGRRKRSQVIRRDGHARWS